ncbi:DNA polymerase IV [Kineosporia babensis]|uniref:DNA polymerase IV n=1 Tax=Kineosporia babensis TaxID=499548 RepID=A0A9X1NEB0_9ACTN|nr:DNA polymerase IV [Kineosporia babensis]MCD5311493.1 DNA polymerase IV [Kineosporia babensis]
MSRHPYHRSGAALSGDDSGCRILHADMDAFYASVELIDRPALRGRPVIVGGGGRAVVLSASYEARRSGIHAAMPMSRARRLCPEAVVIEPDHDRYAEVSHGVMEVFRSVTPLVEPLSLDEAFIDVSGAVRRMGSPSRIAALIRDRIADEQRITCSVGIATTKFVAKLASAQAKPDGILVIPRDETVTFLHGLPAGALWGVGEKTEQALGRLGLLTVADIAHTPAATLRRALGDSVGRQLHDLSWGRDPRPVVPWQPEKSIGNEETFGTDVDDPEVIGRELLRLSERVAARARAAGLIGRTVVIKIRFADFTTITRSRTLSEYTDLARVVHATALGLYTRQGFDRARLRLVGVRLEGLVEASAGHHQLTLDERPLGWREAERAIDRASARFGAGAVRPASLVAQPTSEEDTTQQHPAPRSGPARGPLRYQAPPSYGREWGDHPGGIADRLSR